MGQTLGKLEDNYRNLRDEINEQATASFSIETSSFKVSWCPIGPRVLPYTMHVSAVSSQ